MQCKGGILDMVSFRLLLTQKRFYVYQKRDGALEREYIDGNPWMAYDGHQMAEHLQHLLAILKNNHNLDEEEKLHIDLIGCADDVRNQQVKKQLADQLEDYIELSSVLPKLMRVLSENAALHIEDFGINYDGLSYIIRQEEWEQDEFRLLAYTVSVDHLMEHVG